MDDVPLGQQLAIARTLITDSRLLVSDEPTEDIQPNVVAEIERIIVDLASRGDLSVLLVEQHVGFSLRASDVYCVNRVRADLALRCLRRRRRPRRLGCPGDLSPRLPWHPDRRPPKPPLTRGDLDSPSRAPQVGGLMGAGRRSAW